MAQQRSLDLTPRPVIQRNPIHDSRVTIPQSQESERYLRACELGVLAESTYHYGWNKEVVEIFHSSPYLGSWQESSFVDPDLANSEIACQLYSTAEKCELLITELRSQADRLTQEADSLLEKGEIDV